MTVMIHNVYTCYTDIHICTTTTTTTNNNNNNKKKRPLSKKV